jgi:hypothetical protein
MRHSWEEGLVWPALEGEPEKDRLNTHLLRIHCLCLQIPATVIAIKLTQRKLLQLDSNAIYAQATAVLAASLVLTALRFVSSIAITSEASTSTTMERMIESTEMTTRNWP